MGKEKKEIGKLIELLNEYQKENKRQTFYSYNRNIDFFESGSIAGGQTYGESLYTIISKKFGFIKRLVENDKIELGRIKKLYRKSNEHSTHTYPVMSEYSDLDSLLMLLSISDTPIEDLLLYLK